MRWAVLVAPLAGLSGNGCLLFTSEGQPCDRGQCLPGYVCVDQICVKAGVTERGEPCTKTAECKDGVCSDVNCGWPCTSDDDCFGDASCQANQCTCQPRCRASCTYPDDDTCDLGLICQQDVDQQRGFCQEGQCGPADSETCTAPAVCMAFHGPGSGLCVTLCEILAQQECLGTPPATTRCCPTNQLCQHFDWMWNASYNTDNKLGICMQGGDRGVGATCSDTEQQLFCSRGLFCDTSRSACRRYCNLQQDGQPTCASGEHCNSFSATVVLPYGWCQ